VTREQLRKRLEVARVRLEESVNVTDAFKLQLRKRIEHKRGDAAVREAQEQLSAAEAKEVLDWQEWNMLREQLAADGIQIGAAR
jgi:hypothetical protein